MFIFKFFWIDIENLQFAICKNTSSGIYLTSSCNVVVYFIKEQAILRSYVYKYFVYYLCVVWTVFLFIYRMWIKYGGKMYMY